MNILHTECSMNWGGQEYRTVLEHNHLNNNNHTSYLACDANSAMHRKAKELGAVNLVAVDFRKTWRLDVAMKVRRFCRAHRIDIINSHGGRDSSLCLFAFWSGVALVRSRHITGAARKKISYQYFCSHVIAAAAAIKNALVNLGVDEKKISVIGEGVDLEEYKPADTPRGGGLAAEFDVQPNDIVVVNIGMIRSDKGQRFFLDAAKRALQTRGDMRFFLVGAGTGARELEMELRDEVRRRRLESRFTMTGYRDDIAAWVRLADFIVIASTGIEAQSRVAPQAFAGKKTVIATNVGGLPELVRDNITGLIVPPADTAALSAAILRLAGDKALRMRLANNAYRLAQERLSFQSMMDKTLSLYARLARKPAACA
ncbi:MAG: glycosyltransferase family 4 protein [Gammaproteobacteria bacterium]